MINNKVTFTIVFFLITILFYVIYKSEIVYAGNNRNYYLLYLLIIVILLLISFIALKFSKFNLIFIITFLSTIISFYLFEFYTVYSSTIDQKIILEYKKKTGLDYDKRSKIEVYTDIFKEDKKIKLAIGPYMFLSDDNKVLPLSGITSSKTIHCNENGYYSIYQSDKFGFNNPDSVWNKRNEILLLGDSFVHGNCVDRPHDLASKMRLNSELNIINLGFEGNGPLLNFAILKEFISNDTNIVLYFFFEGNDFENLQNEWKNKILQNYLNFEDYKQDYKNQIKIFDKILINRMNYEIKKTKKNIAKKTVDFLKLKRTRTAIQKYIPDYFKTKIPIASEYYKINDIKNKNKQILIALKALTNLHNAKLYIVYLPSWERQKLKTYKKNDLFFSFDPQIYDLIKKQADELEIEIIDVQKDIFEIEKNPLSLFPFSQRGHYSANTYDKIAKYILTKIF